MHMNMNVHHIILAVGSKLKLLSLQADRQTSMPTHRPAENIKKKSMINDEPITP